jgi:hypothetical protein
MTDAYSGIDPSTFLVTANVAIDGARAGENLAGKFTALPGSRREWKLKHPLATSAATLTVAIRDRQGNTSRIERKFSVEEK